MATITREHLFIGKGGEIKRIELPTWQVMEEVTAVSTEGLSDETGALLTDESGDPLIP